MTADMSAQFLRDQGYLVLKVDNRGADRRGLAFEAAIKGDMGRLEVDDQVRARAGPTCGSRLLLAEATLPARADPTCGSRLPWQRLP